MTQNQQKREGNEQAGSETANRTTVAINLLQKPEIFNALKANSRLLKKFLVNNENSLDSFDRAMLSQLITPNLEVLNELPFSLIAKLAAAKIVFMEGKYLFPEIRSASGLSVSALYADLVEYAQRHAENIKITTANGKHEDEVKRENMFQFLQIMGELGRKEIADFDLADFLRIIKETSFGQFNIAYLLLNSFSMGFLSENPKYCSALTSDALMHVCTQQSSQGIREDSPLLAILRSPKWQVFVEAFPDFTDLIDFTYFITAKSIANIDNKTASSIEEIKEIPAVTALSAAHLRHPLFSAALLRKPDGILLLEKYPQILRVLLENRDLSNFDFLPVEHIIKNNLKIFSTFWRGEQRSWLLQHRPDLVSPVSKLENSIVAPAAEGQALHGGDKRIVSARGRSNMTKKKNSANILKDLDKLMLIPQTYKPVSGLSEDLVEKAKNASENVDQAMADFIAKIEQLVNPEKEDIIKAVKAELSPGQNPEDLLASKIELPGFQGNLFLLMIHYAGIPFLYNHPVLLNAVTGQILHDTGSLVIDKIPYKESPLAAIMRSEDCLQLFARYPALVNLIDFSYINTVTGVISSVRIEITNRQGQAFRATNRGEPMVNYLSSALVSFQPLARRLLTDPAGIKILESQRQVFRAFLEMNKNNLLQLDSPELRRIITANLAATTDLSFEVQCYLALVEVERRAEYSFSEETSTTGVTTDAIYPAIRAYFEQQLKTLDPSNIESRMQTAISRAYTGELLRPAVAQMDLSAFFSMKKHETDGGEKGIKYNLAYMFFKFFDFAFILANPQFYPKLSKETWQYACDVGEKRVIYDSALLAVIRNPKCREFITAFPEFIDMIDFAYLDAAETVAFDPETNQEIPVKAIDLVSAEFLQHPAITQAILTRPDGIQLLEKNPDLLKKLLKNCDLAKFDLAPVAHIITANLADFSAFWSPQQKNWLNSNQAELFDVSNSGVKVDSAAWEASISNQFGACSDITLTWNKEKTQLTVTMPPFDKRWSFKFSQVKSEEIYVTRALFNASILSDLQKELTRPKAQAAILKIDEKPDSNGKLSLELTITPLIPALQIGKRIRTKVQTVLKKNESIPPLMPPVAEIASDLEQKISAPIESPPVAEPVQADLVDPEFGRYLTALYGIEAVMAELSYYVRGTFAINNVLKHFGLPAIGNRALDTCSYYKTTSLAELKSYFQTAKYQINSKAAMTKDSHADIYLAAYDFSITAGLWGLDGNYYDLCGFALEDIKARRLRMLGDPVARLDEDPRRVIRALRFMAEGFQPDAALAEALKQWQPGPDIDQAVLMELINEYFNLFYYDQFCSLPDIAFAKLLFEYQVLEKLLLSHSPLSKLEIAFVDDSPNVSLREVSTFTLFKPRGQEVNTDVKTADCQNFFV
ncbi:hypothetical protein ACFORL_11935 [Legionella dresdenensis]|uniref:Protein translocase subunit SecA n=1 Tax=Legionella dresdenensis TaxID=450200 RepID=A0ABV8CIA4_9GAMM